MKNGSLTGSSSAAEVTAVEPYIPLLTVRVLFAKSDLSPIAVTSMTSSLILTKSPTLKRLDVQFAADVSDRYGEAGDSQYGQVSISKELKKGLSVALEVIDEVDEAISYDESQVAFHVGYTF